MKPLPFCLPLILLSLWVGCARHAETTAGSAATGTTRSGLLVSPQGNSIGRITSINSQSQYVVVNLAFGQTPPEGKVLRAFRKGAKVGQVRITGPQRDHLTAADILSGNLEPGDDLLE